MKRSLPVAAAVALVIGIFLASANPTVLEGTGGRAADAYYSQLVEAFQAGQVSLAKAVPPGLAQLADPYDPVANYPYRMPPTLADDLTYFRGKFYVYFGPTPALLLLWPWAALTGRYLFHSAAVLIFCLVGFLAAVGSLCAIWRRYFPAVSAGVAAAGVLALGLATSAPILLQRADVWEVAIACSYALTMLTLAALGCAWHTPARRARWLAAASLAFGLALGARPAILPGAVILLLPIATVWGECRRPAMRESAGATSGLLRLALAAILPLFACGLALMLYNYRRFGSPWEFGQHYQLASDRQGAVRHFSPHYLWFNFRIYFLEPMRWGPHFPFVQGIAVPPLPAGHGRVEDPFGILPNIPFVGLALAAPLAWRGRGPETSRALHGLVIAVSLLFALPALTLCLFYGNCSRYELEFLPALVLLAVIGVFALERALAGHPAWRWGVRCGWGLLLAGSVAFNLLDGLGHYVEQRYAIGNVLFHSGKYSEAAGQFESALRVRPEFAEAHNNLGNALLRLRRPLEAREQYETAVQQDPDLTEAHYNLGNALAKTGRPLEAVAQYEQALRLHPDYAQAHYNLSVVLAQLGRAAEAQAQYREAVRLRPEMAPGR
jgi:cytochrome c-type biogenesis protein CcmH/NrfG